MAKFDVKSVNFVICGKKQNAINLEYRYTVDGMIRTKSQEVLSALSSSRNDTFFGDIGTNESMSLLFATNKASFYDIDNKMIIHGLYRLAKTKLRSTATKKGNSEANIDVYVPTVSNDLIGMCLLYSYGYGLTKEMEKNPIRKDIEFNYNNIIDSSYHYVLSNDNIKTYTYPTMIDLTNNINISTYQDYIVNDSKVLEDNHLSNFRLSSIFSPSRNIDGIRYNYIIEMPLGTILNKYEKGYIQCDMAITKVPHNYHYEINISSDNYDINLCREYVNIGLCGDLAYLTYRDNVDYISLYKTVTYYDNLDLEYDQLNVDVLNYKNKKRQDSDSYKYLHVEVIHSINRFDMKDYARHKSSLFSIKLLDTGLNESAIPSNIKAILRLNISNNIRKIAEKICPANTQLFNVYFEGK